MKAHPHIVALMMWAAVACPAAWPQNSVVSGDFSVDGGPAYALYPGSSYVEPYIPQTPPHALENPVPLRSGEETTFSAEVDSYGMFIGPHVVDAMFTDALGLPTDWFYTWFEVTGAKYITGAEWFVDADPGEGSGTPVPWPNDCHWGGPVESMRIDIDSTGLSAGMHVLYLRARDQDGVWGPVTLHGFEVGPSIDAVYIVYAEWTDDPLTPYGSGHPMSAVDQAFDEPIEDVAATFEGEPPGGIGSILVRCQDSLGRWSTNWWESRAPLEPGCYEGEYAPNKATPSISTWPGASSIVYGQTLADSLLTGGAPSVPGVFSFDTPAYGPAAGYYPAFVTFTPNDLLTYNPVGGMVVVAVAKATPLMTAWPTATPIVYGQTLASSTLIGGASGVPGSFAFNAPGTAPNAGLYSAVVIFTPVDTANYNRLAGSVDVTVNKANPVVTWPTATLTYGQTLLAAVLAGGVGAGIFTFDTPEVAPTVADSGAAYAATFTPTDTTNYNTLTGTMVVMVNKADPVVTWPTATLTYGQTLSAAALSGGIGAGTFTFDAPATAPAVTDSGPYAATFTPMDAANYNVLYGTIAVTVNKADPVVTWPTAALTYGQTLAEAVQTGGGGAGTFTFDAPTTQPAVADSGTAYPATFTPADTANYNVLANTIVVTVNKAEPVVTWPTATLTYGQTLSAAVQSGGVGAGTFTFDAPATQPAVADSGTAYAATFTPTDTANYSTLAGTMVVTVNKADPVVTWPTATLTYGQTLSVAAQTGGVGAGIFTFDTPAVAPTVADSGTAYAATFTPSDAANFNVITGTMVVMVNKANPVVTWPTAMLTYGQTLSAAALAGGVGAGVFTFDTPAVALTVADSGTPYAATFTPTDAANFNVITGTMVVTVNKADPVVTWPTATLTYGQTLSAAAQTGGVGAGTFTFDAPTTQPAVADSGAAYAATFTPTDIANYNTLSGTIVVTVNKADPAVTWPTATLTYGQTLAAAVQTGGVGAGAFAFDAPATSLAVADSGKPVAATFTPTDSANYNVIAGTIVVTINKAAPVVTWPAFAMFMSQRLDEAVRTGGSAVNPYTLADVPGAFAFDAPATILAATGSQEEPIAFTPSDLNNYLTVSGWATVTVSSPVSVAPTAATLYEGDTVELTASSLLATDTTFTWAPLSSSVVTLAGAGDLYTVTALHQDTNTDAAEPVSVTGNASGGSATSDITVLVNTVTVSPAGPLSIEVGQTVTLTAFTNTRHDSFDWQPTASTVATVTAGSVYNEAEVTGIHAGGPIDIIATGTASQRSGTVALTVVPVTPNVTAWPTATAIAYGQTLANSTLNNGQASVPGTFAFTTPSTTPNAGTYSASVTFTPTDTANYGTVSGTVNVTVSKANPAVTWPTAALTYGQALSAAVQTGGIGQGVFAFSAPATKPSVADSGKAYAATFAPTDTVNYNTLSGTIVVTVNKATPSVTAWPTASAIVYGQTLASSTLSGGTASVPGIFSFVAPGTVPSAGVYSASVTFTPSDTANYKTVSGTVNVLVTAPEGEGEPIVEGEGECAGYLLGRWPFDGNLLDSVDGHDAQDFHGAATYVPGISGQAAHFDGASIVTIADAPELSAMSEFSLDFWMRMSAGSLASQPIINKFGLDTSVDDEWLLEVKNMKLFFGIYSPSAVTELAGTAALVTGRWYHVVASFSNSRQRMEISLDGQLDASRTAYHGTLRDTSQNIQVGGFKYFGTSGSWEYFSGDIDQLALWYGCTGAATEGEAPCDIAIPAVLTSEPKANMPEPGYGTASAWLDGKLHVLGGEKSTCGHRRLHHVYDPVSNTWDTTRALMITPRLLFSAATVGNKLYAIAGSTTCSGYTSAVEAYEPVSNTWTACAPLPAALALCAATELNGKLYVTGGFAYSSTKNRSLFIYDPIADQWTQGASFVPDPLHPAVYPHGSAVVLNGRIYVSGYEDGKNTWWLCSYEPMADQWTIHGVMPATPAVNWQVRNHLMVLGGYLAWAGDADLGGRVNIHLFDMPSQQWLAVDASLTALNCRNPNVIGDGCGFYVLGGASLSAWDWTANVQYMQFAMAEPSEGEGEPPVEGEGELVVEGEGEPPVEGEGEPFVEGEGEAPAEGEGEPMVEGEGEAGCSLPPMPDSPGPGNGVVDVPTDARLSWYIEPVGAGCEPVFDIYVNGTLQCEGITAFECDPGPLTEGARQEWQVLARNSIGETWGPVWSFTTQCSGSSAGLCLEVCEATRGKEDSDGDGLPDCQETFRWSTDPEKVDTDGDGLPDGYEVQHEFDPLAADSTSDADGDALSNLEEYLLGSDPRNPLDPVPVIHVDGTAGSDTSGTGTAGSPFQTIQYAIGKADTSSKPVRIVIHPGTYKGKVTLKSKIALAKASGEVRILGALEGAADCAIEGLAIEAVSAATPLMTMANVAMTLKDVVLDGASFTPATGLEISGAAAANGVLEKVTFTRFGVCLRIKGAIPKVRRCIFKHFTEAGIRVEVSAEKAGDTGGLGNEKDAGTGWNTFSDFSAANAVISNSGAALKMENNDWGVEGDPKDPAVIAQVKELLGGTSADSVDVEPFLAKGAGILAGSIYCAVVEAESQKRLTKGSVQLTPSSYTPITASDNGVYAFPAVGAGTYTLKATAFAYLDASAPVIVADGAEAAVTLALSAKPQEGEAHTPEGETGTAEGESEGEPAGKARRFLWCGAQNAEPDGMLGDGVWLAVLAMMLGMAWRRALRRE